MPRPSRTTAHYLAENAPTATRGPSRASGFVLRREAAARRQAETLLECPVFGVERPVRPSTSRR